MKTYYVKAKIDKTQQNSKCRLCVNRDKTINQIISECSKLAQKEYKNRHNWVGKVIHKEFSQKFKIDQMNKWYMHNLESILKNETHKVPRDFEIQTDYLILVRWSDLVIVNKKTRTCQIVDFAIPPDHRVKIKESEKIDKFLDLARKLKKLWNMKVKVIPIVNGVFRTIPKGLVKGLEDLKIRGQVEIIQTRALLRSARILRRVLETWGGLLSLKTLWKTIS